MTHGVSYVKMSGIQPVNSRVLQTDLACRLFAVWALLSLRPPDIIHVMNAPILFATLLLPCSIVNAKEGRGLGKEARLLTL